MKQFKTLNPMRKRFDSLHCNAIILSFVGRRHEICQLYQVLNHESRAYIFDVQGHPGFLVGYEKSIKGWVEKQGHEFEEIVRWLLKLENMEFEKKLKSDHKAVYKQALRGTGRFDEWEPFVKTLRDNPHEYTYYIKGYLLPMIERKRRSG